MFAAATDVIASYDPEKNSGRLPLITSKSLLAHLVDNNNISLLNTVHILRKVLSTREQFFPL